MRKIYTAITIMLFSASTFAGIGTSFVSSSDFDQATPTLETSFLEFMLPNQVTSTIEAKGDDASTVSVVMPYGSDLSELIADFKLSTGATAWVGDVKQVTGTTANDFSADVVYSIVNGTDTAVWTVKTTVDEAIELTFNVDMAAQAVNEGDYWLLDGDVIYVTGSFVGWAEPGQDGSIMMEDADGDLVYTATVMVAKNTEYAYKYFLNAGWTMGDGANKDWVITTMEENLSTEDTWTAIVNKPDAIEENVLDQVSMYPNPVKAELTIANLEGVSRVVVSNVLGQTMISAKVTNAEMKINTADFRNGIYVVTLVSENGKTRSQKIVKE